jgi:hypothetical protein
MKAISSRMVSLFVLTLIFALPQALLAGVIRDDRADSLYTGLGNDARYASVGQILGSTADYNFSASGVLIANNWVLTAAHVVDQATSLSFVLDGTTYTPESWFAHGQWDGNLGKGYDIGLIKFAPTLDTGIAPAARYTGSKELGKVGTFVGYGMTGTGLTGAVTFDGQKRAGVNTIDGWYRTAGKTPRIFGADFDNPSSTSNVIGSSTALGLEYLISFGDSGGGVFIDVGGAAMLAGINSFGIDQNGDGAWSDYGDLTGHTRVSAFNSWIDSFLNGGTGSGGGGGGGGKKGKRSFDYAANVPEPATIVLLGLTLAAVCGRRARRI